MKLAFLVWTICYSLICIYLIYSLSICLFHHLAHTCCAESIEKPWPFPILKKLFAAWLHTRENSVGESFHCLNNMMILRYVNCLLSNCITKNLMYLFYIPVGCITACGIATGLNFSFYIRHLQSQVFWVNLLIGEDTSIGTGLISFVSLMLILIMKIKSIGLNGSGQGLLRETTISRLVWHMFSTICCMSNWIFITFWSIVFVFIVFQEYRRGLGYMSMVMLASMQLVIL